MYAIKCGDLDITQYITSCTSSIEFEESTPLIGNASSIQFNISVNNTSRVMDNILNNKFYIYKDGVLLHTLNVVDMPEVVFETLELKLYDNLILTNVNYDTNTKMYPCTVIDQLEEMKTLLGIDIDYSNLPSEVLQRTINEYDNREWIRIYLCQIAEAGCCNIFCKPNGNICFYPISKDIAHNIENDSYVYSFKKSNRYTVSMVMCELLNLYKGDESGNILKTTENNPYITSQEHVDLVFDKIGGIALDSIENLSTRSIQGLKLGEIVKYKNYFTFIPRKIQQTYYNGKKTHDVINIDGKLNYSGKSSYLGNNDLSSKVKRVKLIVDELDNSFKVISEQMDGVESSLKNSINVSFVLNYIGTQTKDEALNKFYPDYEVSPLKITATVKDTFKNVYTQATVTWKRKGQNDEQYIDLVANEVATNNVLTISHNLNESVEYIAYATVTTTDHKVLTAENTVKINFDLLKKTEVDGSMCSIVTTTNDFIFSENDYEPNNIVLTPQLFGCNFDSYSYSIDLGLSYTIIEVKEEIMEQAEGEEPTESHIFTTNVEGIRFNNETKELIVQSNASCFELTNVVVFKLKTDVLGYENTTTLTKTTDVNNQLNNIKNEINALVETNKNLSLTLDGLNNSINSKVENIEKTITDDMTEIKQTLSNVIQTSDSIEEQFKVLKEIIDENGNELQTITTYIRKTAKGIEVGELDANVKTLMGTSYFAILFNNEEKMKLEQNLLTIEQIKAILGLQLGPSIFSVKSYGFDITWGGD